PDLVVDSFSTTPWQPVAGQSTTMTVGIRNVGTAPLPGGTTATITVGGSVVATLSYAGPIPVGGVAFATSSPMSSSTGTYVAAVAVDPANATAETVETNNARSFTVVVARS